MRKKNHIWWAFVLNPLVVIVYSLLCYILYSLTQYGGVRVRLTLLLIGSLLLFGWFSWCFYRYFKFKKASKKLPTSKKQSQGCLTASKWWTAIASVTLFTASLVTVIAIYQSGIIQNGQLSAYIQRKINTRHIEFTHNNLHKDHLAGLLEDIDQEITLPEELYISDEFDLTFNQDGEITSISSFIYGLNEDNETESFLIDFDSSKNKDMTIYLNGYVNATYDEAKKLQPLLDMSQVIPLEEVTTQQNKQTWGLYYIGSRNWGYNTEGLVWVDAEGNDNDFENAEVEIIGYTVSLYAPDNEAFTPVRFIDIIPAFHPLYEELRLKEPEGTAEDTFFLDESLGYRLTVADAAMGDRFYILDQTVDGGENWDTINPDPFLGHSGVASGIVFFDEKIGFIRLSNKDGSSSSLYRTGDGGLSFQEVMLPESAPPNLPYKENGKLMLVGNRDQDSNALYQSNNDGETWTFVKEVK